MSEEKKSTQNIHTLNKRITDLEELKDSPEDNSLSERVSNLEKCISKMAHYNGGSNLRILREFGISEYELTDQDMRKSR